MKHYHHIFALSLLGWYLMLPPAGQENGLPWPDAAAPIAQWTIAESFDTAKACQGDLAIHRKRFEQTYHKLNHKDPGTEFGTRFYGTAAAEAVCIATDDPRLKSNADTGAPDVTKSSTN